MTRIALVVSDVDGTLVTKDKRLDRRRQARGAAAARRRHRFHHHQQPAAVGMRFLIEPLGITLPVGPFNGSSIVDPQLKPIEQHLIPASAARRSLELSNEFGVDIWLFTNDAWFVRAMATANTSRMKSAPSGPIRPSLRISPLCVECLQDRRRQLRCGAAATLRNRDAEGWARRQPRSGRRAIISMSRRRVTTRARSWRRWRSVWASRPTRSRPSATCRTIWRCSRSGFSVAMGNATDDVKKQATHVTTRTRTRVLPARSILFSEEHQRSASHDPRPQGASGCYFDRCTTGFSTGFLASLRLCAVLISAIWVSACGKFPV